MALHTKKAFAKLCGLTTGNLSNYATRKPVKVVYSGDYVDDEIEPNKSFLKMRQEKTAGSGTEPVENHEPVVEKPPAPNVKAPVTPQKEVKNTTKRAETGQYYDLSNKKLEAQINKTNLEMEKLKLQNAKFLGEVVPIKLMKPCVLQHNQSILTESKNMWTRIIRNLKKKYRLTDAQAAEIDSQCTSELNLMMKKATQLTVKSITSIAHDFAAKRNVGERT